ncbi:MAG: toll/interleukin-1 receptor domain-containing protein [Myxococcota bacterium]
MYKIFLSYPTGADQDGEITEFRKKLENQLRMKTGDRELAIFQDQEAIALGQSWQARLERELDKVPFLMPIVQPLFFTSHWCVQELTDFHARMGGEDQRILPIYWVQSNELENPTSDAGRILKELQYFDWRPVRAEPWGNAVKRRQLNVLSDEIANIIGQASATASPTPRTNPPSTLSSTDPPPKANVRRLVDLLVSCFSASELRRFIQWLPDASRIVNRLPEGGSLFGLAADSVDLLVREGMLDDAFWRALLEERPRRHGDIAPVAALWGVIL